MNHMKIAPLQKSIVQPVVSRIMEILKLSYPTRVVPLNGDEINDAFDKLDKCNDVYTDDDGDTVTVGLSSNPSSFSTVQSAEEYFETHEYSFVPSKFKMVSLLGSGNFGKVYLGEYAHEGANRETRQYAIKCLSKSRVNDAEMTQILEEKAILKMMENPFVLRLYGTYQTDDALCFVTEVIDCGDLFSVIHGGERLPHEACRFYAACIVMGLDYIHSKKITFRDLKPENIMINSRGYPKIIDFGLAKQVPYIAPDVDDGIPRLYSRCFTLCGTPEYVAPEIILRNGYNHLADVWAFGVLLYEIIARRTPFFDGDNKDGDYITNLFTNIIIASKNGIILSKRIDRITDGTSNASDLITRLLSGDPKKRLTEAATASILKAPYFSGVDADALYEQTIEAPFLHDQFEGRPLETASADEPFIGDQELFVDF